jgi:hypothetical protein
MLFNVDAPLTAVRRIRTTRLVKPEKEQQRLASLVPTKTHVERGIILGPDYHFMREFDFWTSRFTLLGLQPILRRRHNSDIIVRETLDEVENAEAVILTSPPEPKRRKWRLAPSERPWGWWPSLHALIHGMWSSKYFV